MADLLFVAVALAFFALAALYVTACERLVGRERPGTETDDHVDTDVDLVAR